MIESVAAKPPDRLCSHTTAVLLAVASCSKEEPVSAAEYVMDGVAFYVGFTRGMR